MSGVAGEAGKAVHGFMDAMREQPLALALCIMNFSLIGFVYFQSSQFNAQRRENVALFVQVQTDVQKLLSQCIIPPPTQRGELRLPLLTEPVPLPPPRPPPEEPRP